MLQHWPPLRRNRSPARGVGIEGGGAALELSEYLQVRGTIIPFPPPLTLVGTAVCLLAAIRGVAADDSFGMPETLRQTLERSCAGCHGAEDPSGGVVLAPPSTAEELLGEARKWNKVTRVLANHEMPPPGEEPPTEAERLRLAGWIEENVDAAARVAPQATAAPTLRRLNRTELENTLEDLLGIRFDLARELPSDPAAHGFDNVGDVHFTSPVLIEKYAETFAKILEPLFADPERRSRLVSTRPSESTSVLDAARANLAGFIPRAFRRPASEAEVVGRSEFVARKVREGKAFDDAMRTAFESVLLAPHFLFRVEMDQRPEGDPSAYRVTDHELATRLSYFLWSRMPDEELFRLAAEARLSQPDVLAEQTRRLLADKRSAALATNFAGQWLRFREVQSLGVDFRSYPEFNDGLRNDFFAESVAFVDTLVRENRSILELLDADYAFVNDRLAAHYGIEGVAGSELRRVPLPDGPARARRGGVLGMGSILTVTSYPTRTSPVLRGKWMLEELLGAPPPPPPPNIPSLGKAKGAEAEMTLREKLELHRQAASCASCHQKMDPLGFALENFDGIGKWRDKDGERPVDATGELAGGARFEGPAGLKQVLLDRKAQFRRTMVEKMFTYALGRPPEAVDEPAIRAILRSLEQDGDRIGTMIQGIVASFPFQYRRNSQ